MNGKIMIGFGIALLVWGLVALIGYRQVAVGGGLAVVGIALVVAGNRQAKRGR